VGASLKKGSDEHVVEANVSAALVGIGEELYADERSGAGGSVVRGRD
jgi:hypothetical protein